jgi:phage baseplate assembly protein W
MHIAYPLGVTQEGLLANANEEQHILQLIEQLLFTMPGERVNLPDFGTPIEQLVFDPGSDELIAATQFLVQGALQQWLGNLIQVQSVQVTMNDSTLEITVAYVIKNIKKQQVTTFVR